jgi:hypothetical protein
MFILILPRKITSEKLNITGNTIASEYNLLIKQWYERKPTQHSRTE